ERDEPGVAVEGGGAVVPPHVRAESSRGADEERPRMGPSLAEEILLVARKVRVEVDPELDGERGARVERRHVGDGGPPGAAGKAEILSEGLGGEPAGQGRGEQQGEGQPG